MMKKLLVLFALFVMLSVVAPAFAGEVDGLWTLSYSDGHLNELVMARENSGILLLTMLEPDLSTWSAYYGPFDGTTSNMTTLVSSVQVEFSLNLTSPTSGVITLTKCTGCDGDPVGTVMSLQKIF